MRTAALALVASALLPGCGGTAAERESASASRQSAGPLQRAWVTYRDDGRGFSVAYPSGWMRARERLTPILVDPREILSLGTYALRPGGTECHHVPENALADLGPADAFLTLQERANPALARYAPRPHPFPLGEHTAEALAVCGPGDGGVAEWVPFRDRGRAFYALYAVGPEAGEETRADLLRVLASVTFDRRQ